MSLSRFVLTAAVGSVRQVAAVLSGFVMTAAVCPVGSIVPFCDDFSSLPCAAGGGSIVLFCDDCSSRFCVAGGGSIVIHGSSQVHVGSCVTLGGGLKTERRRLPPVTTPEMIGQCRRLLWRTGTDGDTTPRHGSEHGSTEDVSRKKRSLVSGTTGWVWRGGGGGGQMDRLSLLKIFSQGPF